MEVPERCSGMGDSLEDLPPAPRDRTQVVPISTLDSWSHGINLCDYTSFNSLFFVF